MSGIEPWALFRLVSSMVRNVADTDEVALAEEADRGWLTLEAMAPDLDIEDVATLARVIAGEGLATTVAIDPPAYGYVVTVHRADVAGIVEP